MSNKSPDQTLTLTRVRGLFAVICIDEQVFRRAKEVLLDRDYPDKYLACDFILRVLVEFFEEFRRMPNAGELRSKLSADLKEYRMDIDDSLPFERANADTLKEEVSEIYELSLAMREEHRERPAKLVATVNGYMDMFIEAIIRYGMADKVENTDIMELVNSTRLDLMTAKASGTERFANMFGDSLDNRPTGRFIALGNVLVDDYCGGTGPVSGDVIGHAAARSGGKSTFADQVMYEAAIRERGVAKGEGRPPRWVYIFNYEKVEDPLTHLLSYGANVPRDTVEQFIYTGNSEIFSRGKAYQDYERRELGSLISQAKRGRCEYPKAEYERIQNVRQQLQQNVMVVDFTPSNREFAKLSAGFVDGIAEFIEQHQITVGNPGVECLAVDYAYVCARRYLDSAQRRGDPDKAENNMIQTLSLELKHSVCVPYGSFGWVAQQLAADEASKARGTRPDPNKFKGCRAFLEHCDYGIVNGLPTNDGYAIFVHSKTRRGQPRPDRIARLIGDRAHWTSNVSGQQIVGNRIVESHDARQLSGSRRRILSDEG